MNDFLELWETIVQKVGVQWETACLRVLLLPVQVVDGLPLSRLQVELKKTNLRRLYCRLTLSLLHERQQRMNGFKMCLF